MTNRSLISINLGGSKEENLLICSIHEEREDGLSGNGTVKWPFTKEGNTESDRWFNVTNEDLKNPPVVIGKKLYSQLFSDEIKSLIKELNGKTMDKDQVVIKLKFNDNPLLSLLPFEIMHDGNYFLFSNNRTLVRYVNKSTTIFPPNEPLEKSLLILAEPIKRKWGKEQFLNRIDKNPKLFNNTVIVKSASKEKLENVLRGDNQYSSIFLIAHGKSSEGYNEGAIVLEGKDGQEEYLAANQLALMLRQHKGCLIFLCSCSTGKGSLEMPLAAVGHHLIYNGPVGSVICMQRKVTVKFGTEFLLSFVKELRRTNDIFQSYQYATSMASENKSEHGVPCLYTRPMKTVKQDNPMAESSYYKVNNRITAVFSLDIKNSKIAIIYPGFIMGITSGDYERLDQEGQIKWPKTDYKYPGLTTSSADVKASKGIIAMLGKVYSPKEIADKILIATDEDSEDLLNDPEITHYFFFGSRSHSYSREILKQYSEDFEFSSTKDVWTFRDKRKGNTYEVHNPSIESNSEHKRDDYAIIEKIIDDKSNKIFFIIAGMWDSSTLAAGNYLLSNVDDLYNKFGNAGFQIILKTKAGEAIIQEVIEERSPLNSNEQ